MEAIAIRLEAIATSNKKLLGRRYYNSYLPHPGGLMDFPCLVQPFQRPGLTAVDGHQGRLQRRVQRGDVLRAAGKAHLRYRTT